MLYDEADEALTVAVVIVGNEEAQVGIFDFIAILLQ